jgi:predicted esterase
VRARVALVASVALAAFTALGVSVATRAGYADTPAHAPIASVSGATSAAPPAPTPPPDPSSSTPDAPPHLLVTPPNYTLVDAGWDRPIRVLPAATPGPRVLVYLHGYCGDVNAPGAFVPAAAAHGTLIALLGDQPCKDKPGRFKWSQDIHGLDERIKRAVRLVNRALKLELDPKDITLFGYSQGAVRAESLARYYSKHYPRVILGGPPRRPKPEHFTGVSVIAVFGGEKEDTHDMLGGAQDMIAAGEHARFFLLPGVDHGDFGGEIEGNRSLQEVLEFVSPSTLETRAEH